MILFKESIQYSALLKIVDNRWFLWINDPQFTRNKLLDSYGLEAYILMYRVYKYIFKFGLVRR